MSSYFEPNNKEPKVDEFVSIMDRLTHWVLRYQVPLIVFVAIGFLLLVGALVIKDRKEQSLMADNAKIYEALKSPDATQKLETLVKELEDSSAGYVAELKLAQKYLAAKDKTKAFEVLTNLKKKVPDILVPVITLSQAQLLWQESKFDEAKTLLDSIKEDPFIGQQAQYVKAMILKNQGDIEAAKTLLSSLAAASDKDSFVARQAEASLYAILAEASK